MLFQQGLELADHGDWATARDRFERAMALHAAPAIELNLAMACEHTGALVSAVDHFERVRRDPASSADFVAQAQRELATVRPRLGRLTVHVDGPRDGVTLRLDERAFADALVGVEAPADPGHHVIVAMRDAAEVARAETDVAEGGAATASLTVPPRAAVTPQDVAHHDDQQHHDQQIVVPPPHGESIVESPWFWTAIGVGIAAVVVVVVVVAFTQPQAMLPDGTTSPGTIRL